MSKSRDEALSISNPRLLVAVYFSLLAIVITIAMDTVLYGLGVAQLLPISKAIFLAVIVAACFGALFGRRIIYAEQPYHKHVFFWAFLMVVVALPFYNLGFVILLKENHATMFAHATFGHLLYLYLFVLLYSFILVGVWLAIIAGLAAIYLRGHVVYYILQSQHQKRERSDEVKIDSKKNAISIDDTN